MLKQLKHLPDIHIVHIKAHIQAHYLAKMYLIKNTKHCHNFHFVTVGLKFRFKKTSDVKLEFCQISSIKGKLGLINDAWADDTD